MKMIINGKKVDSVSGATFEVTAPATGKVIDTVPKATGEDIKLAVDAAVIGQKIWAEAPIYRRAEVIYKFLDIVEQNKESLAKTLSAENGKPITEARIEIGNVFIGFRAFCRGSQTLLWNHYTSGDRSRTKKQHAAGYPRTHWGCGLHYSFQLSL